MKTDNELIAEFMGGVFRDDGYDYGYENLPIPPTNIIISETCFKYAFELKCYYTWDWLMPVVEKIEKDLHVTIKDKHCEIANADRAFIGREGDKLKSTYKAVVEFIKWHNERR